MGTRDIINIKLTSSKKNISVDDDAQIKIEHFNDFFSFATINTNTLNHLK